MELRVKENIHSSENPNQIIVEVRNLSKRFNNSELVLQNISFYVSSNEKVVLFGHNGSGKTTLLRCIMGFENFEGEIKIFGENITKDGATHIKKFLGYIPQIHPIMSYNVSDFVEFALISKNAKIEDFEKLAETFELKTESILKKKLNELSGGMRQKLFLILALINSPKLLLLDEPFSNLDIHSQNKLSDILRELKCAQIISTHRIEDVYFADRVIYLQYGKMQADLPREDFLKSFSFILKGRRQGNNE
ncbi:MAG: ABC transporter ATP-binding protein [Candidatus Calescibacterium sp.]|nr:ABC transporter ATP-binding protein [Candidatus Calescibacterium sp.]MCX7733285.1 ABC transporter ATP-binding protein [bacterium]MDW8086793.1 ABC transporter ATP-binding protein [Candidatus Calescibacterium sp.]